MKRAMWHGTTLLLAMALASEVFVDGLDADYKLSPQIGNNDLSESEPYKAGNSNDEFVRHIHSMFDGYRGDAGDAGERMVVETNALVDTKYRAWKRNADLINSILALPKGMNDAGR